jgi:hypothetical protein
MPDGDGICLSVTTLTPAAAVAERRLGGEMKSEVSGTSRWGKVRRRERSTLGYDVDLH